MKPLPPKTPQIKLFGYRALVRLDAIETAIELPELSAQSYKDRGTVVLLGDGRIDFSAHGGAMESTRHLPFDFNVGDHVLLSEHAVTPFDAGDGYEYRIVFGADVVGIVPLQPKEQDATTTGTTAAD